MKLICARNFENLEKLYVTDNPFVNIFFNPASTYNPEMNDEMNEYQKPKIGFEFLKTEVFERTGGEVIVENVEYKMREREKKKRGAKVVVFGDLVVVKEENFNKAAMGIPKGTDGQAMEYFGVDFAQK